MPSTTATDGIPADRFVPPERFNMADHFLEDRIREGRGGRTALLTDRGPLTYDGVRSLAHRLGHVLREAGVEPEQRVLLALPDVPEFVGALFGTLKIGGVVVMVNPHLRPDAVAYLLEYTRARVALVHVETEAAFRRAATGPEGRHLKRMLTLGSGELEGLIDAAPEGLDTFPSHRDDAAIWLFSGGTTGHPKAVLQTHTSFANTTECYAKGVLGLGEDDVTLSVPKLYFGYATGSNLLFPFAVGGAAALFAERSTAEALFERIERHRPTLLVNVPTMVRQMLSDPSAERRDLSCLRLATSAGEALPLELHRRWDETFGVELLDGLGTAEMWHIFLSNRPGRVRPGTLGEVVPGFDVRVADDHGHGLPDGEVGALWVKGDSRALHYWQRMDLTKGAFRGEWYVSGDMISRSPDGYFTYHGRADDLLKVKGKWVAPSEVENRLLQHTAVREAAVVGVPGPDGLVRAHAFVVAEVRGAAPGPELADALRDFVREGLESHKAPEEIAFLDDLPRTHLGKVDRGAPRGLASE